MSNTGKVFVVAVALATIITLSSFAMAGKGSKSNGNNSLEHQYVQDSIDVMISSYVDNWDVWRYRAMLQARQRYNNFRLFGKLEQLGLANMSEVEAVSYIFMNIVKDKFVSEHTNPFPGTVKDYNWSKLQPGTKPPSAGWITAVWDWVKDHAVDIYNFVRKQISDSGSDGNEPTPDALSVPEGFQGYN